MSKSTFDLDAAIRKVPDFPKPGILFYDITSVLANPGAFNHCLDEMQERYANAGIDAVAAIEARGFVFASPFAANNRLPLLLMRKKGKLPGDVLTKKFTLEYGEDEIQVHSADIRSGWNVLLVDDLIATGGTARAAADLLLEAGAASVRLFSVVGLPFLHYEKVLEGIDVDVLITYEGE